MYETAIQCTAKQGQLGVEAEGLGKRYGDHWALRDVDLSVPRGSVLGLLGHNGAGKTTAIRILTTLARPTTGSARIAGIDVETEADLVRGKIGVAGQDATVDGLLTARANLCLLGRLYGISRIAARNRADELLERVGLSTDADRIVKTFSGGMRRRLDLAASLISEPAVIFLDEPTTGLDPQSRNDLWEILRERVSDGATLVLTTQYLEEADRLADEIVLLDGGRVAAAGSPADLKRRFGGDWITVTTADTGGVAAARAALAPFTDGALEQHIDGLQIATPVPADTRLIDVIRALDAADVEAVDVGRREATLDDVYFTLTHNRPTEPIPA